MRVAIRFMWGWLDTVASIYFRNQISLHIVVVRCFHVASPLGQDAQIQDI